MGLKIFLRKHLFTPTRLNILSQLLVNLAAGWFGLVLIVPGVTRLQNVSDFVWLTKNFLLGIVAVVFAIILSEKRRKKR